MIRVSVEMLPRGDDDEAYLLAQGVIINTGGGTPTRGEYDYGLTSQASKGNPEPPIWKEGRVDGFPRKRDNVWRLLKRCLDDAL